MQFSSQEYWSGLPCPPPRDLPNPEIEPTFLTSPELAGEFFTTMPSSFSHNLVQIHVQPFSHYAAQSEISMQTCFSPPTPNWFLFLTCIHSMFYLFIFIRCFKKCILDSEYSMSTRFMDTWFRGENLKHHFKEAKNKLSGPKCWLGGKWGGVHEENTQDGSWKRFKAESSSYSSGSSCSKTETRHSTQFPALNASCRGAEPKEAQYTGRSLRLG